jgi:CheY-like chemotaxis protein
MAKELVLMVDDELDNRVMMRYFLESWGYEVELAADGQEALQKVAERRPALVLLDLEMPVMDGFETCHRLKDNADTEDIPVIMFTGLEATADKVKGIRRGADDYVVKTVDPEEIQARIEMILRRSKRYEAKASAEGDSDAVLSGSLQEKNFPEAFQLAMAYGKSGSLVLKNGDREGRVYLNEGNVVHATYGELQGEEAFFELSVWNEGQFSYVVSDALPETTIQTSGTSLLMEATRRMDEWNLISSKIPNFDVVPHRVSKAASESIRLTKADWKVLSQVDGSRSIREIAETIGVDQFDCGRTVFGLMTLGVLSFDADKTERDTFYDAVPELRAEPTGQEPYELSATHWKILACIDGKRDLGVLTHLVGLSPRKMAEFLKDLADRGFVRVNKPRDTGSIKPTAAAPSKSTMAGSDAGKVEAFTPRIRAIGFE